MARSRKATIVVPEPYIACPYCEASTDSIRFEASHAIKHIDLTTEQPTVILDGAEAGTWRCSACDNRIDMNGLTVREEVTT